jgi:hypothetical protein
VFWLVLRVEDPARIGKRPGAVSERNLLLDDFLLPSFSYRERVFSRRVPLYPLSAFPELNGVACGLSGVARGARDEASHAGIYRFELALSYEIFPFDKPQAKDTQGDPLRRAQSPQAVGGLPNVFFGETPRTFEDYMISVNWSIRTFLYCTRVRRHTRVRQRRSELVVEPATNLSRATPAAVASWNRPDRADDYSGHPAVARCRKLIRGRRWLMVDAVFVAAEVEMDVIDMVAIGIGIEHFVEIAAGLARHRM